MRIAVVGDIGGHWEPLRAALVSLGADPVSLELPDDLVVVQVGDLVHRGPASAEVLELVDGQLRSNPERWVQLVGNHETHYLAPPQSVFGERLDDGEIARMRGWLADRLLRAAVAIDCTELGETVITHAGVTAGFWRRAGSEGAAVTAARINRLLERRAWAELLEPGCMLGGHRPNVRAGPVWAEASLETRMSWANLDVPFSQVHGHSSPFNWAKGRWQPPQIAELSRLDRDRRHVWSEVGGRFIVGIDPGLGSSGAVRWAPLVLDGELLD